MTRRQRAVGIIVVGALGLALLAVWRGGRATGVDIRQSPARGAATMAGSGDGRVLGTRARDVRQMPRATIEGAIIDLAGAPIARARVCAALVSDDLPNEVASVPRCGTSDEHGRYRLENLYPATYTATAMAKPYRSGRFHPGGDRHVLELRLAAGEHKIGVDIVLEPGGVELVGRVADVSGGAIAHAQVHAAESGREEGSVTATVESDDQGQFSLWVAPGDVQVTGEADGYAPGGVSSHAPGKVLVLLTPESSLAGTVVDGAGQPVAGASVELAGEGWAPVAFTDVSDASGHFRVSRITPGRFAAIAHADHGYGRTEGSILVGLGQHVDGAVIRIFPVQRIEGTVVIAATGKPCPGADVTFHDNALDRWFAATHEAGGRVHADGVRAGTYLAEVTCRGYRAKDSYPAIPIADHDVTGLVWNVDAGAVIRGKVLTKSGDPIEGASVWASSTGGAARAKAAWDSDASSRDGSYELASLKPGSYRLNVSSDYGVAPKDGFQVELKGDAVLQRDLVLDAVGAIRGTIVDAQGTPVSGVHARATGVDRNWGGQATSDDLGVFTVEGLPPADYRVTAGRGWSDDLRKPGTTDDAKQGERVTVRPAQTAVVKLVVESQSGTISGSVSDAAGNPIGDAFVSTARESDAVGAAQGSSIGQTRWTWSDRPVLTSPDGTFVVTKLSPGHYTLRAYRRGGGEAVAEHVAVGARATLKIRPTGSIAGTATSAGAPLADLTIVVRDVKRGFNRTESFYSTGGRFTVRDLPAGHFTVRATAAAGQKSVEVDLDEGETKDGVEIELEALITLTGRLVDLVTKAPVPGMRMYAQLASGGSYSFTQSEAGEEVTDESGQFTLRAVPRGLVAVRGFPKDWDTSDYPSMRVTREVPASAPSTFELGDLLAIKRRLKSGDPVGELGINFADPAPGTPLDKQDRKVSYIDPAGPAARTELVVGDVVIAIDGVDITGANIGYFATLVRAPPGTKLVLGLARHAAVTVVLAAP